MKKFKFDYVIGNPPYNASGIVDVTKHSRYYKLLGSGGKHGSLAFIMKAIDVLKTKGKMCYIIPTNGMVLVNSIGFRKYVSKTSSIINLWVTNKDVFRNKITNKLEACIQGNTFIIQIQKEKNKDVVIETEYSNNLVFNTEANYTKYNNSFFPLLLSKETEAVMNKIILGENNFNKILMKGALHNNISNDKIVDNKTEKYNIKVMKKLNRGTNIKYGWTNENEGSNLLSWKVVFSPICKIKEIMQYGGISTAIIPPNTSVQTNYSYLKLDTEDEAIFIQNYLKHPMFVTSLFQLFDNAYINDSNLGRLSYPDFDCEDYWKYYNIEDNDKRKVIEIYNTIYEKESSLMKKNIS